MPNGNGSDPIRAVADSHYLRAVSNVVSVISGPIVIGLAIFLVGLKTDVTKLQGDVMRINDAITSRTALRYTSDDATRDKALSDFRFNTIEQRLNSLETRVK